MDSSQKNPSAHSTPAQSIQFMDYWKIVVRGRWTILAVFTIVVALVALWTFTQTRIYRASATVEVRTETRRVLPGQDVSGMGASGFGWSAEERYYNTQIEILKSRDLAERVVQHLKLDADPEFQRMSDPAAALAQMIAAQPRTDTGILEISLSGPDPARITEIVNAYADEYVKRNIEKAQQSVLVLIKEMEKQAGKLSESAADAERQKFVTAGGVPESQKDVLGKQILDYSEAHTKAQIRVATLGTILGSVDSIKAIDGDLLTIDDIAKQPSIAELVRQRSDLEREIEGLRVSYLPGHPKMQDAMARLDSIKQKINDQVDRIIGGYRGELNQQEALEKDLSDKIAAANKQLLEVGKNATGYDIAKRAAETQATVYSAIMTKLNEISVTSQLLSNNLNVLDKATIPLHPIRPRKVLNLFLAAFFGILGGVGTVFFLDHLDNTVKSIEDVEQGLKLPVLSIIPRYRETTGGAVKEAFQTLKTNVLFSSDAKKLNVLLLTSAGPKEGKSSTVFNLARTMASAGERVVIVDCDLRRPTVHIHLDLPRDHGLTNYLTGTEGDDIESFIKETKQQNLFALTCGPIPPNPPELFGGDRFKQALRELRSRFDWIVVDSPPVISLTDSVILASMADMVAFVVKHNETDREMIRRCLRNIQNVNPHVIGAVLNDVDIEKSYSKDYYYAGYYYSPEGAPEGRRRRGRAGAVAPTGASIK